MTCRAPTVAVGDVRSVEEATEVTPELVEAVARLVPQLSRSAPAPADAELAEIVAVAGHRPPGGPLTATAASSGSSPWPCSASPPACGPGSRTWSSTSRSGAGAWARPSCREALRRAAAAGARTVDLTSRPSREAANRLYRRLGFVERETNVYRYELGLTQ